MRSVAYSARHRISKIPWYKFARPLEKDSWARFAHYRNYVVLMAWDLQGVSLTRTALSFGESVKGLPLLPNLNRLYYHAHDLITMLSIQRAFLTPMVKALDVYSSAGSLSLSPQTLSSRAPYLTCLGIHFPIGPTFLDLDNFATAIASLESLENLCCDIQLICAPTAWKALAGLEKLRTVEDNGKSVFEPLDEDEDLSAIQHPFAQYMAKYQSFAPTFVYGYFPALHSITVQLKHASAESLFHHEAPVHLSEVTLLLTDGTAPGDLFVCIARSAKNLTMLAITYSQHDAVISSRDIQALTPLSNLQRLHLSTHLPIQILDDDLAMIVMAFPVLKELELTPDPVHHPTRSPLPQLTYKALLSLAELCPEMTHVALYINMNIEPNYPGAPHMFNNPVRLNLGFSPPPEDADSTVLFLCRFLNSRKSEILSSITFSRQRLDIPSPNYPILSDHWRMIGEIVKNVQEMVVAKFIEASLSVV